MKIYKKKSFWIVGVFTVLILLTVIKCCIYESKAMENVKNCEKVNHDMSIDRVVEIMGEPDDVKTYRGKIDYKDMKVTKYYYDAPSGSSVGVNIFFDAKTNKVVRTECKD